MFRVAAVVFVASLLFYVSVSLIYCQCAIVCVSACENIRSHEKVARQMRVMRWEMYSTSSELLMQRNTETTTLDMTLLARLDSEAPLFCVRAV